MHETKERYTGMDAPRFACKKLAQQWDNIATTFHSMKADSFNKMRQEEYMNLIEIGLSNYDLALLILCPLGALIGSFAFAITATISELPPNNEHQARFASNQLAKARGAWLALRVMLGAILGFLLGLYFIGAIQETPSTLAKVVALSMIAGYAAPKIWLAQDKVVSAQIERAINTEVSKYGEASAPKKQNQPEA